MTIYSFLSRSVFLSSITSTRRLVPLQGRCFIRNRNCCTLRELFIGSVLFLLLHFWLNIKQITKYDTMCVYLCCNSLFTICQFSHPNIWISRFHQVQGSRPITRQFSAEIMWTISDIRCHNLHSIILIEQSIRQTNKQKI